MARMSRLVVAGQPHLVIQRGGKRTIFRDDVDRMAYLAALLELVRGGGVIIHAYVLLDDRVMLLASPGKANDLGHFMQRLSRRYVPAFYKRHGGSGPLLAGRFQAAPLEPERYLLRCTAMIEQAPVNAGLVALATEWAWSSARHHVGRGTSAIITEHAEWWRAGNTPFEREARHEIQLQRLQRADHVAELLDAARGGWLLGSPVLIGSTVGVNGRPLRPRPRGRPRSR